MDIKVDKSTVVVFDLDDTLFNELDYLKSAFKAIAQRLEPKAWKPLYAYMFSLYRSKENVFTSIADKYQLNTHDLINWYRFHQPNIQIFDGAFQILSQIKERGGRLALLSDGRVNTQMAKVEALGIAHLFDQIVISEALGTEKPHVNNFQTIEDISKGQQYYYIADNFKKDFVTPNSKGWCTIGLVDNGMNIHYQHHEFYDPKYLPQYFIISLTELNII